MKTFIDFVTEITRLDAPESDAELKKAATVMGRKLKTFKNENPDRFTYRKREIAAAAAPSQGVAGGGY